MNYLLMHKSRIQRKWPVGFQKDFVHILILLLYSQYPFKLINFLISFNIRYDVSRALNKNSWSRFVVYSSSNTYVTYYFLSMSIYCTFVSVILSLLLKAFFRYFPWEWSKEYINREIGVLFYDAFFGDIDPTQFMVWLPRLL